MQQAYVNAFTPPGQFNGPRTVQRRRAVLPWLTRIAVNEAFARVRRGGRYQPFDAASASARDLRLARGQEERQDREVGRAEVGADKDGASAQPHLAPRRLRVNGAREPASDSRFDSHGAIRGNPRASRQAANSGRE